MIDMKGRTVTKAFCFVFPHGDMFSAIIKMINGV